MNKLATEMLFDMLVRHLQAWEGEEDSVRGEHSELIEETRRMVDAYLIPKRSSPVPTLVVAVEGCKTDPSLNNDNSSEPPQLPWRDRWKGKRVTGFLKRLKSALTPRPHSRVRRKSEATSAYTPWVDLGTPWYERRDND